MFDVVLEQMSGAMLNEVVEQMMNGWASMLNREVEQMMNG